MYGKEPGFGYVMVFSINKETSSLTELTEEEINNTTLIKIENLLQANRRSLAEFKGGRNEYLSSDSIDKTEVNYNQAYEVLTQIFLSSLRVSGLPNHIIKLKVGTPTMLMRNLDQAEGLCNGIRLIVTSHEQLYVSVLRVKSKSGLKILIHNKENSSCLSITNIVFKEAVQALS
ncbi:uncharacterized protein LOC127130835 [Lathyrus oleraceus]|uniref:uncharacterized protein LOC127130835 n=1 Tax=Pisum sativum TaxID=3888 RepID=UPI0021D3475E|nr:uncharacterized protein LOC127130835 [Pisum sativum]